MTRTVRNIMLVVIAIVAMLIIGTFALPHLYDTGQGGGGPPVEAPQRT